GRSRKERHCPFWRETERHAQNGYRGGAPGAAGGASGVALPWWQVKQPTLLSTTLLCLLMPIVMVTISRATFFSFLSSSSNPEWSGLITWQKSHLTPSAAFHERIVGMSCPSGRFFNTLRFFGFGRGGC